jgi:hypothetical protein
MLRLRSPAVQHDKTWDKNPAIFAMLQLFTSVLRLRKTICNC